MAKDVTRNDQVPARRPGDLLATMRADLDRVFDRFERGWPSLASFGMPSRLAGESGLEASLDVREEGDKLVIEADLPGVDDKDVSLTLAGGVLTIKGERRSERDEKKDSYHIAERSFGRFERSLRLPDGVDENAIQATFEKGVLKIVAPKRPEAVRSERKIEIGKA
ncbi:MAG: Hsp20/alpha crystallin family protein [Hyphomicrobiaceae bacterium]